MQPRKHENTKGKYWVFFVSSWLRGCAFLIFVSFVSFVVAPQAQQPPTFRTGQTLIVQTVIVKDKDGKPVEGLTAKDFSITEDSEPQTITFVEFQRLPASPGSPASPVQPGAPAQSAASGPADAPPAAPPFIAAAGPAAMVQPPF